MTNIDITEKIIGCAYTVSNTLGTGFLEKVYENAMMIELNVQGLTAEQQKPVDVLYKENVVGEYFVDLLVENTIIVELKVATSIAGLHQAQLMNYLTACNKKIGLIVNFGNPKVEIKRLLNGF